MQPSCRIQGVLIKMELGPGITVQSVEKSSIFQVQQSNGASPLTYVACPSPSGRVSYKRVITVNRPLDPDLRPPVAKRPSIMANNKKSKNKGKGKKKNANQSSTPRQSAEEASNDGSYDNSDPENGDGSSEGEEEEDEDFETGVKRDLKALRKALLGDKKGQN